ncbi:12786_t:CDS:1, partial [Racocetra persica]
AMNNQYCSAYKTTLYNLVFGQLSHSKTRLADILINNNNNQEESNNTDILTNIDNLESNNDNESYDYLSILDDYYNQDKLYNQIESLLCNRNSNNSFTDNFESRLNLEDSISSNNSYNNWNDDLYNNDN